MSCELCSTLHKISVGTQRSKRWIGHERFSCYDKFWREKPQLVQILYQIFYVHQHFFKKLYQTKVKCRKFDGKISRQPTYTYICKNANTTLYRICPQCLFSCNDKLDRLEAIPVMHTLQCNTLYIKRHIDFEVHR